MKFVQLSLLGVALCSLVEASSPFPRTRQDLQKVSDSMVADFGKLYPKYHKTGILTPELKRYFDELSMPTHLYQTDFKNYNENMQTNTCLLCRVTINVLLNYRRVDNKTDDFMWNIANDICATFHIQPDYVCRGIMDLNVGIILHIIDNRPKLSAETICGLIFQSMACTVDNDDLEWSLEFDEQIPEIINTDVQESDEAPLTIVQITDVHFDPNYKVGSNAVCGAGLCCRESQGPPLHPEHGAGKWGDPRGCDIPWIAVEDLLQRVKATHKNIDYIYFTGDILDHGVWETTKAGNIQSINKTLTEFKNVFGDIPVFPAAGNHEPHPLNVFPSKNVPQQFSLQWLYDGLAEEWSRWLAPNTKESIKKSGYYTQLVRPGFRIITLNNNECLTYNWWLLFEPNLGSEQLNWLISVLLKAEQDEEKVHILAHIPSGEEDCMRTYSREYRRIVDRFSHIIMAQFNGHTHKDTFIIFYNRQTGAPNNVAFNGGSATSYTDLNPNYRVYQVEPTTYEVLDYQTYSYNLTAANLAPDESPNWFLMYSFKDTYNVESLSPSFMDKLAQRFANDRSLLYKYFEYKHKFGDVALNAGCDDACLDDTLCDIVSTEFGDRTKCDEMLNKK